MYLKLFIFNNCTGSLKNNFRILLFNMSACGHDVCVWLCKNSPGFIITCLTRRWCCNYCDRIWSDRSLLTSAETYYFHLQGRILSQAPTSKGLAASKVPLAACWLLVPWRCTKYGPPKHVWRAIGLYGVTFQMIVLVITVLRTSTPPVQYTFVSKLILKNYYIAKCNRNVS